MYSPFTLFISFFASSEPMDNNNQILGLFQFNKLICFFFSNREGHSILLYLMSKLIQMIPESFSEIKKYISIQIT